MFDFSEMPLSSSQTKLDGGEGAIIIGRCAANEVVSPDNVLDFSKAMIQIRKDWDSRISLAQMNREIVTKDFTREEQVSKLEKILVRFIKV